MDDGGVVDQDVDLAPPLQDGIHRTFDLGLVGNVHLPLGSLSAGGLNLAHHLFQARDVSAGDSHRGAFTGQSQGYGPADAPARPGHQGDFSG